MTLKQSFCSSPWIHVKIQNSGQYDYCRWAVKQPGSQPGIDNMPVADFFQKEMIPIRQQLLDGQTPAGCVECSQMEQHGKVSGRQKQLLKVGVTLDRFEKTMASSPWFSEFARGATTDQMPQDWQIDLGNYCNSGCVFCNPRSSSRLAQEFKTLGLIQTLPQLNWSMDPVLVERFGQALAASKHIRYLHFIGGETLITPGFKTILQLLIDLGLNQTATIGFTTNLTVWKQDVADLLCKFQSVQVGFSVETLTSVNDYVRWPAELPTVQKNLDQWIALARQQQWLTVLRTTPTCLTVHDLLTVYDFAWQQQIPIESCNFLTDPEVLKPSVLPSAQRQSVVAAMREWLGQRLGPQQQIVNIRDPNQAHQQIAQDLASYVNYLENEPDQSNELPALVQYLKLLESSRGNSVLDYIPEYENIFRSAGY